MQKMFLSVGPPAISGHSAKRLLPVVVTPHRAGNSTPPWSLKCLLSFPSSLPEARQGPMPLWGKPPSAHGLNSSVFVAHRKTSLFKSKPCVCNLRG